MHRKKNIVHVIPSFNFGGAEIYLLDVLKNIDKEKYNIHLITIRPNINWFQNELDNIENLSVYPLNADNLINIKWVFKLRKLIKSLEADIVHTHLNLSILIIGLLKRFNKSPKYVATQHSVYKEKSLYYKLLKKLLFSHDIILANSKYTENYLINIKGDSNVKIKTIVLGVDFQRYNFKYNRNEILKELGIPEAKTIVGNIGRYKHHKGHQYLIHTFHELLKDKKDIHLVLVGSGPLKEEIILLVNEKKMHDYVTFVEETKNVSKYLSAFDVYCSTSVFESFGISILEAIMFNIPIASFNTDAIPELVIDNQTGLLAEKENTKDLAKCITTLLEDEEMYNRIKGHQKKILNNYTIENHLAKLESFYDNINPNA